MLTLGSGSGPVKLLVATALLALGLAITIQLSEANGMNFDRWYSCHAKITPGPNPKILSYWGVIDTGWNQWERFDQYGNEVIKCHNYNCWYHDKESTEHECERAAKRARNITRRDGYSRGDRYSRDELEKPLYANVDCYMTISYWHKQLLAFDDETNKPDRFHDAKRHLHKKCHSGACNERTPEICIAKYKREFRDWRSKAIFNDDADYSL